MQGKDDENDLGKRAQDVSHLSFAYHLHIRDWGFLGGTSSKESPANAGDTRGMGLIPRSGRSPGEESGNPLQYCCLENPMERGAWQATAHGDTKELDMTEQLNTHTHIRD